MIAQKSIYLVDDSRYNLVVPDMKTRTTIQQLPVRLRDETAKLRSVFSGGRRISPVFRCALKRAEDSASKLCETFDDAIRKIWVVLDLGLIDRLSQVHEVVLKRVGFLVELIQNASRFEEDFAFLGADPAVVVGRLTRGFDELRVELEHLDAYLSTEEELRKEEFREGRLSRAFVFEARKLIEDKFGDDRDEEE